MKKYVLLFGMSLISFILYSQTITKTTTSVTSGTVCPVSATYYEVSVPNGLTSCQITWTATNGTVTKDATDQRKAKVEWNDTPGASGTVTATFGSCSNSNDNGTAASLTELILSVKNKAWDPYGSSVSLDYCTTTNVYLTVPRMIVQGTGGIAQPPATEVNYVWTLPAGWKEVGSNNTGTFMTPTNFITIQPVTCATPGNVTVYGTLANGGQFCNSAEKSATATISLNGANPVITVGPQPGYTGGSDCDTNNVTFYATPSVALGCITGYDWQYPPSWTFVSKSGNSIILKPSGTQADSGPIKATANFSCGAHLTSGAYTPPFTAPSLTGSQYVCGGGTPYTFNNVPVGATITWTASPAYLFTTTSGSFTYNGSNGFTLTAQNIYQGGVGASVTATVATACSTTPLTKSLYVGLPYANATANGQQAAFSYHAPYVDPDYTYNMVCSGPLISVDMSVDGATSNGLWQRVSANPTNAYWSVFGNNNMEFSFFAVGQTAVFRFSASNGCGTVAKDYYFKSYDCSGGGGGGCLRYTASPNPASSTINVMVPNIPPPCDIAPASTMTSLTNEETQNELSIQSITLIDAQGQSKHSQQYAAKTKKVDLDISELKKGVYILRVSDGNYIEDHRIIIK